MLVLRRKTNESILIGNQIRVSVLQVEGNRVKIGIEAPDTMHIVRAELLRSATSSSKPVPPTTGPTPVPSPSEVGTSAQVSAHSSRPVSRT